MRWCGAALIAGALCLSACGSGDSGVSPSAGRKLDAQVDAIRVAAARTDRDTVRQRVVLLRASVDELHRQGELSDGAAERILDAVAAVESRLVVLRTTTTTTTTTPAPPSRDEKGDRGPGGKGKHKDGADD
jgi:hypothetical protein